MTTETTQRQWTPGDGIPGYGSVTEIRAMVELLDDDEYCFPDEDCPSAASWPEPWMDHDLDLMGELG